MLEFCLKLYNLFIRNEEPRTERTAGRGGGGVGFGGGLGGGGEVGGGGGGKSWKLAASLVKEKGGSRSEERKREVLG